MGVRLIAVYDGQCEVCQAGVSWIRALDLAGVVECASVQDGPVTQVHPALSEPACLAQLHVVEVATGRVHVGWNAVVSIMRELPILRRSAGLDRLPAVHRLAGQAYRWVAANRTQLSACRGGSCSSADPGLPGRADGGAFWTCYSLGLLLRLPLVGRAVLRDQLGHVRDYARTFRRRIVVLDGRLELWFLGGVPSDLVPLVFGERFCTVWHRGVLVDPGSVRMRRSLAHHLARGQQVTAVTATHAHEEHVGSLEWVAHRTGAPLHLPERIERRLRPAAPIPAARSIVIGTPPSLTGPVEATGAGVPMIGGRLEVLPAPGHSPDHVVLWDPGERVLMVGDSFMGAFFSSPNADVDSRAWLTTLERLLDLDISIMVEGHGHVHTLRPDVPDVAGVVIRTDPKAAIAEKIKFLRWLSGQLDRAATTGMSVNAAVATCFPWGKPFSWERLAADEIARVATAGEFSRHELIRSFYRSADDVLPTVLTVQLPSRDTAAHDPRARGLHG